MKTDKTKEWEEWEEWEDGDPTWNLLENATSVEPSARFADDTVRLAKSLPKKRSSLWKFSLLAPVSLATAYAAVVAFSFFVPHTTPHKDPLIQQSDWTSIEDEAEVEILIAAADHLDEFSNQELITLIGL